MPDRPAPAIGFRKFKACSTSYGERHGLISIIAIEIGLLTPPLGLAVFGFTANLEDQRITTWEIFMGTMPMTITMTIVLVICVLFPWLALVLVGQKWSGW